MVPCQFRAAWWLITPKYISISWCSIVTSLVTISLHIRDARVWKLSSKLRCNAIYPSVAIVTSCQFRTVCWLITAALHRSWTLIVIGLVYPKWLHIHLHVFAFWLIIIIRLDPMNVWVVTLKRRIDSRCCSWISSYGIIIIFHLNPNKLYIACCCRHAITLALWASMTANDQAKGEPLSPYIYI